jgi:hypothetical protein
VAQSTMSAPIEKVVVPAELVSVTLPPPDILLLSGHTVKSAAAPPTNQGVRWPSASKVASCLQDACNQKRPECCVWTMSRVRRDPLIGFQRRPPTGAHDRDALESGYPHRLGEEGRACVRMRREPTF